MYKSYSRTKKEQCNYNNTLYISTPSNLSAETKYENLSKKILKLCRTMMNHKLHFLCRNILDHTSIP